MKRYLGAAFAAGVTAAILIANITLGSNDKVAPRLAGNGVLLTGAQAATALCQGVDPITETNPSVVGSCGGRINICNALNRAATITSNSDYLCGPPTTPHLAPTNTNTAIPGTATPTPHVILGGRDG